MNEVNSVRHANFFILRKQNKKLSYIKLAKKELDSWFFVDHNKVYKNYIAAGNAFTSEQDWQSAGKAYTYAGDDAYRMGRNMDACFAYLKAIDVLKKAPKIGNNEQIIERLSFIANKLYSGQ